MKNTEEIKKMIERLRQEIRMFPNARKVAIAFREGMIYALEWVLEGKERNCGGCKS